MQRLTVHVVHGNGGEEFGRKRFEVRREFAVSKLVTLQRDGDNHETALGFPTHHDFEGLSKVGQGHSAQAEAKGIQRLESGLE